MPPSTVHPDASRRGPDRPRRQASELVRALLDPAHLEHLQGRRGRRAPRARASRRRSARTGPGPEAVRPGRARRARRHDGHPEAEPGRLGDPLRAGRGPGAARRPGRSRPSPPRPRGPAGRWWPRPGRPRPPGRWPARTARRRRRWRRRRRGRAAGSRSAAGARRAPSPPGTTSRPRGRAPGALAAEGVDQRLDLGEQRAAALHRHRDAGAGDVGVVVLDEQAGRVGDRGDALRGQVEAADLVDRAEAVLHRPHHPEPGVAVALEVEHHVDEVLEHPRARRSSRPW